MNFETWIRVLEAFCVTGILGVVLWVAFKVRSRTKREV